MSLSLGPADTLTFVLGMHRSGTSALARTLGLLGHRLPEGIVPANTHNETGFWEPEAMVRANDEILRLHQRFWADPKPLDLSIGQPDAAKAVAEAAVAEHFAHPAGLVLKDPRLSLTLPYWVNAFSSFDRVRVVIALRNPLEVARSLQRSAGVRLDHALRLWQTYTLEAERHSRGMERRVVRYDALLADWRDALGETVVDAATASAVDGFLASGMKHHTVPDGRVQNHPDVSDDIKALYATMTAPGDLDSKRETLDALHAAWREHWRAQGSPIGVSRYAHRLPFWNMQHARTLEARGDREKALVFAAAAVKLSPNNADFRRHYAGLLIESGHTEDAIVNLQRLVRDHPNKTEFRVALAAGLHQAGKTGAAEHHVASIAERTPNQNVFLGNLRLARGRVKPALEAFDAALAQDPAHKAALAGRERACEPRASAERTG